MPEELEPQPRDTEADAVGDGGAEPTSGLAAADRLALLASYVQPDGWLRVPGLIVADQAGNDRIVLGVDGRRAQVAVRMSPVWSPAGTSEVGLYAVDGDDQDIYAFPPELGLDVTVGGDGVITVGADLTTENGVMGAGEPDLTFFPWGSLHRDAGDRRPNGATEPDAS